jgi:energy-coupling factor transporter transmembrane protein EcfT
MNKTLLGYVPEESIIYQVHPFVKLYFLLVVSLFPLFITAPEWNALILIVTLILMAVSCVNMSTLRIYVPVAISMGTIIFLSYTIFGGTQPQYYVWFRIFGFPFYWERIRDAIVIYFRVLPMIATMVFFLSTSRERDVIVAMRSVRIPFVVTYVFAMALRSAGMVLEDFNIVRQAEKARGFDTKGRSLPYKLRKYIMYMIPLFALSLRRSEEFTNALIARGYAFTGKASKIKRADYILSRYTFHFYDGILVAIITLIFLSILILHSGFGAFGIEQSLLTIWISPL